MKRQKPKAPGIDILPGGHPGSFPIHSGESKALAKSCQLRLDVDSTDRPARLQQLIDPTPRQQEFLSAIRRSRFVLYGGAMGGGKSYILRWWLVHYLLELAEEGVHNAQVGLFCEDYPSLQDRQISKIRFEFPPELGELRQGVTRDFVLWPGWGGGRIALRNLDDPSKYQSAEFAAIAVDELTKNGREVFDFLRTRLRWPGVDRPRFAGATNPGGIGHGWVKALWIDRKFPLELEPLAGEFTFVPARAEDNPHLTASYYEELKTLPPDLAKAYAEGRWDIFAGQFFDVFDPSRHVLRAEEIRLEDWWPRWISIDYGFAHDSAVYWHCYDGHRVYTYRELVENRLTPRELAFKVAERSGGEKIETIYLSHDAFARRTDEHTAALQMTEIFRARDLPSPAMADTDRKGGWLLMYQFLRDGKWLIADSCARLIATLPVLVRDERDVEDVAKMDGDDPADAARYGLKGRFSKPVPPPEDRLAAKLTATDPTIRNIQFLKAQEEERKKLKPFHHARRRFSHNPRRDG
ncbi:MAG TPA: terminase family protein [Candidatus Acidoferrales bacterium]|nr:terminase family protein [Candidatus Acidoferrales bacterium]